MKNVFINFDDLCSHEIKVCKDVKCSECPFSENHFCRWRVFFNDELPKYQVTLTEIDNIDELSELDKIIGQTIKL